MEVGFSGTGEADGLGRGGCGGGCSLAAAPGRRRCCWGERAGGAAGVSGLLFCVRDGRAAGLTLGGVVLTVNGDQGLVERQLAGGELACPKCGGVLGGWGHGRLRRIRLLDGPEAELVPFRSRCAACKATHVLLPAWCLLRRADASEVVGAAVAAAVAAIAGAAAAVAARWPQLSEVPVWAAASAASGGLLLAPGWPAGGGNTNWIWPLFRDGNEPSVP